MILFHLHYQHYYNRYCNKLPPNRDLNNLPLQQSHLQHPVSTRLTTPIAHVVICFTISRTIITNAKATTTTKT